MNTLNSHRQTDRVNELVEELTRIGKEYDVHFLGKDSNESNPTDTSVVILAKIDVLWFIQKLSNAKVNVKIYRIVMTQTKGDKIGIRTIIAATTLSPPVVIPIFSEHDKFFVEFDIVTK